MQNALKLLESRRRNARPKTLATPTTQESMTPSGIPTVRGTPSLVGMKEWLQALGHSVWVLNHIEFAWSQSCLLNLGKRC